LKLGQQGLHPLAACGAHLRAHSQGSVAHSADTTHA
jgi:hypothetical protein